MPNVVSPPSALPTLDTGPYPSTDRASRAVLIPAGIEPGAGRVAALLTATPGLLVRREPASCDPEVCGHWPLRTVCGMWPVWHLRLACGLRLTSRWRGLPDKPAAYALAAALGAHRVDWTADPATLTRLARSGRGRQHIGPWLMAAVTVLSGGQPTGHADCPTCPPLPVIPR